MSLKPRELWIDMDYSNANIFDHDPSKSFQDARLANKILHVIEFAKVRGLVEALEQLSEMVGFSEIMRLHAKDALKEFKGEK